MPTSSSTTEAFFSRRSRAACVLRGGTKRRTPFLSSAADKNGENGNPGDRRRHPKEQWRVSPTPPGGGKKNASSSLRAIHDAVNEVKNAKDLRQSLHELSKHTKGPTTSTTALPPKDIKTQERRRKQERRAVLEHMIEKVDSKTHARDIKEEDADGPSSSSSLTTHTKHQIIYQGVDGGFVVGSEKPRKHTEACACPNCNFLRKRILEDRGRDEVEIRVLEDDRVLEMVGDDPEAVLRPETTMANELRRRERISLANRGNVPWNKGRKHSQETIEKIRQKTMERMKTPEVRAKIREAALLNAGKLSPHTKARISLSVRDAMKKKKIEKISDEENRLVPKESKIGLASYGAFGRRASAVGRVYFGITSEYERLAVENRKKREEQERRKEERKRETQQRQMDAKAKKEAEKRLRIQRGLALPTKKRTRAHNEKISAAIKAKWKDPEYANKLKSVAHGGSRKPTVYASSSSSSSSSGDGKREKKEKKKYSKYDPERRTPDATPASQEKQQYRRMKRMAEMQAQIRELEAKKAQTESLLGQMKIANDAAKVAVFSFEQKLANGASITDDDFDNDAYEKASLAKAKTEEMIAGLCVSIESMELDIQDVSREETKWARRYNKVLMEQKEEEAARTANEKKMKAYLLRERKKKTEEELRQEEEDRQKRAATAAKLKEALMKNKSVVSSRKEKDEEVEDEDDNGDDNRTPARAR